MPGRAATTWSLPYCRPRSVLSFCGTDTEILPLPWRQRGLWLVVSLVVLQPPRTASVPWELGGGPVPCSDRRSVSLEPAVQSRTEMLQNSVLKIYLMPRNLGWQHTPSSGVGHLLELIRLQSSGGIGAGAETGARGRTAWVQERCLRPWQCSLHSDAHPAGNDNQL